MFFTGNLATEEQVHDLLNARAIGESVYKNYITHQIMQVPSVNKPQTRRKRLLTMAPPKETKRKISHKEKEEREISKYLRRRLAWCNQTGQQYDESEEQYSLLPRALAEPDGGLHTGSKSKWTDKLKSRYNVPGTTPFLSSLPWVPQVAIVDAMFAINIVPLRQHSNILMYTDFLFRQYAGPHFSRGTKEVHFVFDHPKQHGFNPKGFEHNRRYGEAPKDHIHTTSMTAVTSTKTMERVCGLQAVQKNSSGNTRVCIVQECHSRPRKRSKTGFSWLLFRCK